MPVLRLSRGRLRRPRKIRDIRNDVMHFNPEGLEAEDLATLRECAQFFSR